MERDRERSVRIGTPRDIVAIAKLSKIAKDGLQNLRGSQRNWLKAREKRLELYLTFAPVAQREQRRLQFFADVTAAHIESLNESEDNEPFDLWERINEKP